MEGRWQSEAEPLIQAGRFEEAFRVLEKEVRHDPGNWHLHYLAGICQRFTGNLPDALWHFREADRLNGADDPSLLLALAIAYQQQQQFSSAIDILRRSLRADPDHLPSINSLAMTQKMMGEPEKAAHNYDLALKKIAQGVAGSMPNGRDAPIFKHQSWEEIQHEWLKYALEAAVYLGSRDGIDGIAWPSGEVAAREEATEEHGGLYWTDQTGADGRAIRLFWPNFFTSFRERMTGHPMYADLVGNRSTVLRMLGQTEEADRLLQEAEFFSPRRSR